MRTVTLDQLDELVPSLPKGHKLSAAAMAAVEEGRELARLTDLVWEGFIEMKRGETLRHRKLTPADAAIVRRIDRWYRP
jgi:hypothetical protein